MKRKGLPLKPAQPNGKGIYEFSPTGAKFAKEQGREFPMRSYNWSILTNPMASRAQNTHKI
jgi:hypothetical protein